MKTLTTAQLLVHMANNPSDYPLGSINNLLSQLPSAEAAQYANLGANLDLIREGGRVLPFSPEREIKDLQKDITNKELNDLERVYSRATDEVLASELLSQMGSDADRPADTSEPSLSELIEASLTAHGEDDEFTNE